MRKSWLWGWVALVGLVGCNAPVTMPSGVTESASPSARQPTPLPPDPVASPTGSASPTPSPTPTAPTGYRLYTVAGNGIKGDSDTGAIATQTSLFSPTGIAMAADGGFYVADYKINKVRHVDAAGHIEVVAGSSFNPGDGGDGGPAVEAGLAKPYGLVIAPNGDLVLSEYGYSVPGTDIPGKVRRIDANGVISRVAGGGNLDVVNGVPAKDAHLLGPEGMAYDHEVRLYIAEYGGHRVVRIESNGTLTLVAGTGDSGYSGDGGPATQALLNAPNWVCFDPAGRLVIVDSGAHVVRRVEANGTIQTIAGTGVPTNDPAVSGYLGSQVAHPLGDGGLATAATLNGPTTAVYDAAGALLISDAGNYLIRRVTPDGRIASIAGNGQDPALAASTAAEGDPARQAAISLPDGLCLGPEGRIYFSEYAGYRVRLLAP